MAGFGNIYSAMVFIENDQKISTQKFDNQGN
jgi:hypothetical protein